MLHEQPEQPRGLAIDHVGPCRHCFPKRRLHRWVTGDVHHEVELLVRDQVGYLVIDRHLELLGSFEPGSRGILIDDADDLNRTDLVERIKQGHPSTARSDDGHSHRRRSGNRVAILMLGLSMGHGRRNGCHTGSPCCGPYPQRCANSRCSMARATEAFSFSPSTGFTR